MSSGPQAAGAPSAPPAPPAPPAAPPPAPPEIRYVGLATRGIAFAIDAAIINLVATVVAFGLALIVSILHLPSDVKTFVAAVGGGVYILWSLAYFVSFWSTTGQTPGNRVMRLRVIPAKGEKLPPRRCVVRCIGIVLSAIPLFAGFVLILFDSKRRGFQDRLARTVVVEAPELSLVEQRRLQKRENSVLSIQATRARSSNSGDDRVHTSADA